MNKNEITNLIEEVVTKISMQVGKSVSLVWDGGQEGNYYIEDISNLSDKKVDLINDELDVLNPQVKKFLIKNNMEEENLWEIESTGNSIKILEGKEVSLLDLSNELIELAYEDIFELNLNEILKDGNIVVDDIQIFFSNVKDKDDLLNCTIQIDKVEAF